MLSSVSPVLDGPHASVAAHRGAVRAARAGLDGAKRRGRTSSEQLRDHFSKLVGFHGTQMGVGNLALPVED